MTYYFTYILLIMYLYLPLSHYLLYYLQYFLLTTMIGEKSNLQ